MLLFGWRMRRRVVGPLVPIDCAHCHNAALYDYVEVRKWFTLFFVPLFPMGAAKHYMVCPICNKMLVFKTEQLPLIAGMLDATSVWRLDEMTEADYQSRANAFMDALRAVASRFSVPPQTAAQPGAAS